ncbi:endonuclease/exonuclease/phosphatase family protein [Streptococcus suis]|uniref:endonuclease/exonuclease/phosphatase family protein n=1 Tax=Streptococcus suis TaxID=1307 RepID=UPI00209BF77B|nr:endonuclease/exonuclease/phosphatase family protein [Streptococcus suis]MCO8233703.1 endonuclease [Streptococcus suis]HEM3542472.1 endonuclease [Streptococcus suis]HEM3610306.1 endonuclease [Streptococcus suis]HEM3618849.1 endonuclease [Streptococcus suis]HEM3724453.1 endonuclease [Streptococcus suis]
MTTKFNELSLLSTNLDFDNHGGPYKNKTYTEIMKFLLLEKPTFLALQEVGDNGNGLKIKELEFALKKHGYNMVSPEMDGIKPVNTRLFYDSNVVKFVKNLLPIYETGFVNRQSGAIFKTKNNKKTVAVFSLHFPLYGKFPKEKEEMWNTYIQFASEASKTYDHVILAGDFNESLINKTDLSHKITEMERYMVDASEELPTWKNKKLDHVFITKNTKIEKYSTLDNKFSDHKALQVAFVV